MNMDIYIYQKEICLSHGLNANLSLSKIGNTLRNTTLKINHYHFQNLSNALLHVLKNLITIKIRKTVVRK